MKHSFLLTIAVTLFILILSNLSFASSVTIDATTGIWDDGFTQRIIPNCEVTFDFRFHNTENLKKGFTNPFKVWTTGGSSFTPVTGDTIFPGLTSYFDLGLFITSFSANGIGADTIYIGGAILFSGGFPSGFNEVIFRLKTGGVQAGETLCLDKVEFPSYPWKWVDESLGDIVPDWSGPFCYQAVVPPCLNPSITNAVDNLQNQSCELILFNFNATYGDESLIRFAIIEGPGTIDSLTGAWSYSVTPSDIGTFDTLVIGASAECPCLYSSSTTILEFTDEVFADFTGDCASDISDLVFLVDFIFLNGPPPEPFLSGDLSGDSEVDITDLVMMVEYIFGSSL